MNKSPLCQNVIMFSFEKSLRNLQLGNYLVKCLALILDEYTDCKFRIVTDSQWKSSLDACFSCVVYYTEEVTFVSCLNHSSFFFFLIFLFQILIAKCWYYAHSFSTRWVAGNIGIVTCPDIHYYKIKTF